ncbi:MAG: hypothetical protein M1170_02320 [Patescibacteria group bacterium]|nr:hypothetical protein [Patescibacteria group bacterium]
MNNKRRYSYKFKLRAKNLRKQGFTHREIVKKLNISLGSAHLWTKGILLTPKQKLAIKERAIKSAFSPERRTKLIRLAKKRSKIYGFKEKYTHEDLLNKIINFYKENRRIPLKKEFNMYREYKARFGSWNNAIKTAGFKTNPLLFAYKFKATDGHSCDSFTEKIIDDWLYKNGIEHKRNFSYGKTKMTADFLISTNIAMEFFGLAGVQKTYDKIIKTKRGLCKKLGLELIEIYPKDIFPKNNLSQLLASVKSTFSTSN